MMAQFRFKVLIVITALIVSAIPSVPMAQAAPLPEVAQASGGTVPQSGNCPGGSQQGRHCLPGGPGSPAGSGSTPTPPVTPPVPPPVTPPVVPPTTLPATQSQDQDLPQLIHGEAIAELHIHDDDRDITYTSGPVKLLFQRREKLTMTKKEKKNMTGNTQYVLAGDTMMGSDHMTWNAKGRVFDCTVEGKAFIRVQREQVGRDYSFPGVYTPLDPTRPVFGYLNVVGPDGGDFHSVIIQMFDPGARLTKTCPGNPPLVTEEKFDAGFLLHILYQQNTHENGRVIFQGHQEYDQGNPLDFLNLLPPGAAIPEDVRRALQAQGSRTSLRYTWTWKLFPGLPPAQ